MSDEQFKSILDNIKKDNKIETDEQFQAALKQENMTLAELRKNLERQMIVSRVQQNEVLGKIAVTDEEARQYYDAHQSEFTTPQTITLREILVAVPGDGATLNVGATRRRREKAEEIRAARAGAARASKSSPPTCPTRRRGQRRPDRSAEPRRSVAGRAEADRADEGRATSRSVLRGAEGLSDPEARIDERGRDHAVRARRASDISNRVFTDKRNEEFEKYLAEAARAGDHRVEERRVKKAYDAGLAAGEQRRQSTAVPRSSEPVTRAPPQWFADLDALAPRAGRPRAARTKHIEVFLPTITRWSRWKDRKKKIDWPLFPGYCFARFDPDDPLPVLKCTGVVNIVSFEGKPAPIPEHEARQHPPAVGSELQFDPCPLIHEGKMVEVVHGPLKGVVGRLMRKDAHAARLVLSVDLIGQAVSVEVDASDVKAY